MKNYLKIEIPQSRFYYQSIIQLMAVGIITCTSLFANAAEIVNSSISQHGKYLNLSINYQGCTPGHVFKIEQRQGCLETSPLQCSFVVVDTTPDDCKVLQTSQSRINLEDIGVTGSYYSNAYLDLVSSSGKVSSVQLPDLGIPTTEDSQQNKNEVKSCYVFSQGKSFNLFISYLNGIHKIDVVGSTSLGATKKSYGAGICTKKESAMACSMVVGKGSINIDLGGIPKIQATNLQLLIFDPNSMIEKFAIVGAVSSELMELSEFADPEFPSCQDYAKGLIGSALGLDLPKLDSN